MTTLLESARMRIVILNATLLFLFASASISDRWPGLTVPAIVVALIVVLGVAVLFYCAAKRAPQDTEQTGSNEGLSNVFLPAIIDNSHRHEDNRHRHEVDSAFADLASSESKNYERAIELLFKSRLRQSALMHHYYGHARISALRPQASRASTWALAALREDDSLYVLLPDESNQVAPRRPRSGELAKWKLITQGDEAFNIVAGAFEIEYFHGRTNIRVLDSSRVTVEGETRGTKSKAAPPNIRPAIYQ